MDRLKEIFSKEMLSLYKKINSQVKYRAQNMLKYINEYGGYQAALKYIYAPSYTNDFSALWEAGRLDLSIEVLLLNPKYDSIVPDSAKDFCKKRLDEYNYKPKEIEVDLKRELSRNQLSNFNAVLEVGSENMPVKSNNSNDVYYTELVNISKAQWKDLFLNDKIFTLKNKELVLKIYNLGKVRVTYKALGSVKYAYKEILTMLAKKIKANLKIEVPTSDKGEAIWWNILLLGKFKDNQNFDLVLHPNLYSAINEMIGPPETEKEQLEDLYPVNSGQEAEVESKFSPELEVEVSPNSEVFARVNPEISLEHKLEVSARFKPEASSESKVSARPAVSARPEVSTRPAVSTRPEVSARLKPEVSSEPKASPKFEVSARLKPDVLTKPKIVSTHREPVTSESFDSDYDLSNKHSLDLKSLNRANTSKFDQKTLEDSKSSIRNSLNKLKSASLINQSEKQDAMLHKHEIGAIGHLDREKKNNKKANPSITLVREKSDTKDKSNLKSSKPSFKDDDLDDDEKINAFIDDFFADEMEDEDPDFEAEPSLEDLAQIERMLATSFDTPAALALQKMQRKPFEIKTKSSNDLEAKKEQEAKAKWEILKQECIEYYGASCEICGMDYGYTYGDQFEHLMDVHNTKAKAKNWDNLNVDPEKDLIPICHNCSAIINSKIPHYTIEEVKEFIQNK
ncbi:MAG: hypothetical protein ATN31_07415 [Candidatus Epulonipiscioides saccharophilum]|nr:MAG: hypothetical protein ATN31_07415 [Epulopiscium sp. AS2M-Bin001]